MKTPPLCEAMPGTETLILSALHCAIWEAAGHGSPVHASFVRSPTPQPGARNEHTGPVTCRAQMGYNRILPVPQSSLTQLVCELTWSIDPTGCAVYELLENRIDLIIQIFHSMQDLSCLTRDQILAPAVEAQSPNHWTTREFPSFSLLSMMLPVGFL